MNRLVCLTTTALLLAAMGSGCCCMDRYYYGDCPKPGMWGRFGAKCYGCDAGGIEHGYGDCGPGGCGDGDCGDACGACGPCGFHPLRSLFGALGCSSGCGEFYVDEWINDPPDKCDPCDEHGGYVGHRPCKPRWFLGVRGLSGRHCGGCDSCCEGGEMMGGHIPGHFDGPMHEGMMPEGEVIPTPEPATEGEMETEMEQPTTTARRTTKPYYKAKAPPTARRAKHAKTKTEPTPALRRVSHEVRPLTAKSPIGSGVAR